MISLEGRMSIEKVFLYPWVRAKSERISIESGKYRENRRNIKGIRKSQRARRNVTVTEEVFEGRDQEARGS
jgi:hypothetical protein